MTQGRDTAVAVTARSVVYTMATSVACKELRDSLCLAIKYKKIDFPETLKTGLETSQTPQKLPLEAASGEDTPRDRFWTNFGLDFGRGFEP